MSRTYTITLTEEQARVVRVACETMARVSCGQFDTLCELRAVSELDTACEGRVLTLLHELGLEWLREHDGKTGTALAGKDGRAAFLVYRVLRDALEGRNQAPFTGLEDAGPIPAVRMEASE